VIHGTIHHPGPSPAQLDGQTAHSTEFTECPEFAEKEFECDRETDLLKDDVAV
jgi:hypothetical protein